MSKLRIGLALALLLFLLSLPPAERYDSYLDTLRHTAMTLKGQALHADVAQDFYGFRALMSNQDPYAQLRPALKTIGVDWKADFSSTHPPTAFLVVAPVAFLPWPVSSAAWAWLMLFCLYLSLRIGLGYSWDISLLATAAALYWPPIATSFDQITILWLFGLALAYRYRNSHPFWSGIFIAAASFTKLFPGVLLVPYILRRHLDAIKGFSIAWLTALGLLALLSPKALLRYFTSNQTNAAEIVERLDNGSFLVFLYHRAGLPGMVMTLAALLLLVYLMYMKFRQGYSAEITMEEWNFFSFLAVLLMPITWIFTIAPLLPNLLLLLEDKRPVLRVLTLAAFLPPVLVLPWGTQSTLGIFGFFLLAGTAIVLAYTLSPTAEKLPQPSRA